MRVRKVGLGYEGTVIGEGVQLNLDRITDSRGEMHGELTVARAPEGHLLQQRFNVSSMQSRTQTAKYLSARSNHIDWLDVLERFCVRAMSLEREPRPLTLLGSKPRVGKVPMHVYPMMPSKVATILFGIEGSYKSTIAAGLAFLCATGVSPHPGWELQQPKKPVLIIDWEAGDDDWTEAVEAVAQGVGYKGALPIYHKEGVGAINTMVHEVATEIATLDIGLVIIDSVGIASPDRSQGGDPNEPAVRLFKVLRQWGITSLLIDHLPKDGDPHRPYGSMYKPALARSSWRVEKDDRTPGYVTLYHEKVNRMAKRPPEGLMIQHGDDGWVTFSPERFIPPPVERELTGQVARIVDALTDAGHALDDRELETITGIAANTIRAVVTKARNRHLFTRVPGGWALA
jgi:hypothetical protein